MKTRTFIIIAGLVLALVLSLWGATVVVLNAVYDVPETPAPVNPAAGFNRIYEDSTTHKWTCLTSSGGSCAPSGGGGGFIQTLTAPSSGSFTQENYNTGASVVTTQVNNSSPVTSITVLQSDTGGTNNAVALDKAKLAATFTLTEAFSINSTANNGQAGLWLSDGGSPPTNIQFVVQNAFGTRLSVFTNFTSFSFDIVGNQSFYYTGPLLWLRVKETASARIYSMSSDGITFEQLFTESNTAHFTTSRYGMVVAARTASANACCSMATLYSFQETNP